MIMAELLEVSVKVIQARHLQIEANSSTQVEVNISDKYKYTKVVKYSDAPFFDEVFLYGISTFCSLNPDFFPCVIFLLSLSLRTYFFIVRMFLINKQKKFRAIINYF